MKLPAAGAFLVAALSACLLFLPPAIHAAPPAAAAAQAEPTKEQLLAYIKAQVGRLHPQRGTITLKDGIATLTIPKDFAYLTPEDTEILIHNIWGNPPGKPTLGAIIPSNISPAAPNSWGVIITYLGDGHVKDDDAENIDYDDLMQKMKTASASENEKRKQMGYPQMDLVGWAEKPHYDKENHKLYWARELRSPGGQEDDLNYDIRVLGRQGVLVMSIVAGMDQLPMIAANKDHILSFINFSPTHRYADFNPDTDKVAAYGMAAMIAGFAAAKVGAFKGLLVVLVAMKKFLILAFVAVAAFFKKLFGRGKPKANDGAISPPQE